MQLGLQIHSPELIILSNGEFSVSASLVLAANW